jgi:hypothetical protein
VLISWNVGRLRLGETRLWVGPTDVVLYKVGSEPTLASDGRPVGWSTANYVLGTTSPSVAGAQVIFISNTSPTTITNFANAFEGQELRVVLLAESPSKTTIANGTIKLEGGAAIAAPTSGRTSFILTRFGGIWIQTTPALTVS